MRPTRGSRCSAFACLFVTRQRAEGVWLARQCRWCGRAGDRLRVLQPGPNWDGCEYLPLPRLLGSGLRG